MYFLRLFSGFVSCATAAQWLARFSYTPRPSPVIAAYIDRGFPVAFLCSGRYEIARVFPFSREHVKGIYKDNIWENRFNINIIYKDTDIFVSLVLYRPWTPVSAYDHLLTKI